VLGNASDAVTLSADCTTFSRNSILLVPSLLAPYECKLLIHAAESHFQKLTAARTTLGCAGAPISSTSCIGLERFPIDELGLAARITFLAAFRRTLSFIQDYLPAVASELRAGFTAKLGGHASNILSIPYKFSCQEPAVNRYTAGGHFDVHTDKQAVTFNVLLNRKLADFEGGGTSFWVEGSHPRPEKAAVRVEPETGVGVLFNGTIWHAGEAVTKGTRYLLVASFDVADHNSSQAMRVDEELDTLGQASQLCVDCRRQCQGRPPPADRQVGCTECARMTLEFQQQLNEAKELEIAMLRAELAHLAVVTGTVA
jgi:hypothetical protein